MVDRLIKSAHFLLIYQTDSIEKFIKIFVREIIRLHESLKVIISNRDKRFTSRLWKDIHRSLGTKLNFIKTFHPINRWSIRKSDSYVRGSVEVKHFRF